MNQNIGFYPESSLKASATTAPITGKFVDNSDHEFNAAIKMNITPAELRKVLGVIQLTTNTAKYDVDDYNCRILHLLCLIRCVRMILSLPTRFRIPNTINVSGSMTPQGLYLELQRRMKYVPADRPNIRLTSRESECRKEPITL